MTGHSKWKTTRQRKLSEDYVETAEVQAERAANELSMAFAKIVYDRRLELSLSQSQLAERAGLTQAKISRIEGSDAVPTLPLLWRIADALQGTLTLNIGSENQLHFTPNENRTSESVAIADLEHQPDLVVDKVRRAGHVQVIDFGGREVDLFLVNPAWEERRGEALTAMSELLRAYAERTDDIAPITQAFPWVARLPEANVRIFASELADTLPNQSVENFSNVILRWRRVSDNRVSRTTGSESNTDGEPAGGATPESR